MSAFRALALNQVRASMRNRVALFFTLGLAVMFMLIFGLLFGGGSFSLNLDAVDNDHTPTSQQYIKVLSSVSGVTISSKAHDPAFNDLKTDNVAAVIVIPQGLAAAVAGRGPAQQVQIYQAQQGSTSSSIADEVVAHVTADFAGGGHAAVSLAPPRTATVNQVTEMDVMLPAMIAYIILQSGINFVAIGLVDMRVRQVLRRLRATPVSARTILASQIAGGALTVLLQILILVLVGTFVFHARNYGSWLLLIIPVALGTAAFVGIGFLLTAAARTSEAARGMAAFIAFPMMFLGGIFIPIDAFPQVLQTIVHILPLTWLSDALKEVMNDGAGLGSIAVDCLVLAAWAVVTFAIASWRFRWE
ncbi:MAG TPA: ABC transporter permease [Candidatus Binatia bacterium]|nr:ABC transporter permease [Candidatus Binatia bacterium]